MSLPVYKTALSVDKGHVRANNEDNVFYDGIFLTPENRDEGIHITADTDKDLLIYAVFDGMGGADFGEEASFIAAEVTKEYYACFDNYNFDYIDPLITQVIMEANQRIYNRMVEIGSGRMGATLAMVVICKGVVKVYNVGDSRVYLYRDGALRQISLDDSFAQRLYRMGVISYEDALVHKDRNKLVQHLGIDKTELIIEPHVSEPIYLLNGDRILLCSDGLTDMVNDDGITMLLSEKDVGLCAEALTCKALENGGRDNISVILIEASCENDDCKKTVYSKDKASTKKGIKKSLLIFVSVVLLFAIVALGVWGYCNFSKPKDEAEFTATEVQTSPVRVRYQQVIVMEPEAKKELGEFLNQLDKSKKLTFSSTDENIASVNQNGVVTAIKEGTAVILASDGKAELEINVTVATKGTSIARKSLVERLYEEAMNALKKKDKNA